MSLKIHCSKKYYNNININIFIGGQMANILVKLDLMGEAVEGKYFQSSNISTNNVSNASQSQQSVIMVSMEYVLTNGK